MTADIDTLLTALYVFVDDYLVPRRRRPGRPRRLSDAELICLMITQVLFEFPRERHWICWAGTHLRDAFPYLPTASGDGKRVRGSGRLIATVLQALAHVTPTSAPILRLIDSTPVPCGTSRETAKRSDLAGDAGLRLQRLTLALFKVFNRISTWRLSPPDRAGIRVIGRRCWQKRGRLAGSPMRVDLRGSRRIHQDSGVTTTPPAA